MELAKWPLYSEEEIKEVTKILQSGKVNAWTGLQTKSFEKEFAKYINVQYAIALSNGTVALTAAYKALGIKSGDQIITTPRTFIATSSTILDLGAKPIFAEVDNDSGNITVDSIKPLINDSTKGISIVHLGGWPADMESICKLAKEYSLYVIEDCSQAHGASINGKKVGSFGDISTWSFCQDKIISTGGEGGMVTTNNANLYNYISSLKDHGKNLKLINQKDSKHNYEFKWLHENVGTNYRLTEIQSAIGRIQLRNLDKNNSVRARNVRILIKYLKDISFIRIPIPPDGFNHAWYKFYIYLEGAKSFSRNQALMKINENGAKAFSGSCSEIYLEKCFDSIGIDNKKRLPVAKKLGESSIMLLVHHTITEKQMNDYAHIIRKSLKELVEHRL